MGAILARHGDAQEARDHFFRAVDLSPQSAELQFALGDFLMRRRRFDEAVTSLTKAVELNPDYAEAQERLREARQALPSRTGKSATGKSE